MKISSNNLDEIKKEHNRKTINNQNRIHLGVISLALLGSLTFVSCAAKNKVEAKPVATPVPTAPPTPTPTPIPTLTPTPEPPVIFTEIDYSISESILPDSVTAAHYGDHYLMQFTTEEGAAFVFTQKETGEYNVYLVNCGENTETSIFDYLTGEEVDLQDCTLVEIHYIDQLYEAGVLKELQYHGDHLGFELHKRVTDSGKKFYNFSFDWRFPYNWGNYYLETKYLTDTVEEPDIPSIWENKDKEEYLKVLNRT